MMYDMSINFYTVCDSAESYFKTIDKEKKGSGYKPFMRWKHENESKFYPTGNRLVDFSMPYNEYLRISKDKNRSSQSSNIWQSLGPNAITNITGHYSAGLGRVEFVEVSKNNDQQIYLGSRSGGLWRTNDGGVTWSHNSDFLPASGVNAIAANPTNFDSVLINVQNAGNYYSFGIYKSDDGGVTFTPTNFVPANVGYGGLGSNFKIYTIQYHPTIPNLVFVGTSQGIYRSTDNLQTWTKQIIGGDVMDIDFHPTNASIIYIYDDYFSANQDRVLKSTDLGITYNVMPVLTGNAGKKLKISVASSCPECVFVSSDSGIWKSTDEAATFVTIQNPPPTGVSMWGAMPNDTDITKFVSGYVDLYRSVDSGASFSQCTWWSLGTNNGSGNNQQNYATSTHYIHADTNYLDCVNGIFYSCSDGFLSKSSDNGVTWQKLSLTIGNRENYCVGVSQSDNNVAICGSQDNGTSIKNELGWIEAYGADGMEGVILPLNPNYMIHSVQNGSRGRFIDGTGANRTGVTPPGQVGYWVAPLLLDPNNQFTVYSYGTKVHKSIDFGTTWVDLGTPTTLGGAIKTAAIAENNSNIMVVNTNSAIELSTDGGMAFTNIKNGLPNSSITDVQFDPNDDATIIVTYDSYQNNGQKIYITHNAGATWQNITYNLGNMPIYSVAIDNSPESTIYVGAAIGIYKKAMSDTTWSLFNTDLPNVAIKDLEINYGSNTIKAATWGRGLWQTSLANRSTFPSIVKTEITSPPSFTSPSEGVDQFVMATINYAQNLTDVHVLWATGAPVFNDTNKIQMYLVENNLWKTNTGIPNFPSGTKIYFKVVAIGNANDKSETYKFMYDVKPYAYCNASGENTNGGLWINNFTCAGNTITTNSFNGGYSNNTTNVFSVSKGNAYTATANFSTGWSSNDFIVWIDYNNDGSFSNNERVVYDIDTSGSGFGSFTIPTNAVIGTVKMRVRLGYWGDYSTACGTTLGEVEDYLVQISDLNQPSITIQNNSPFCINSNINLVYTGDIATAVNWTIQGNSKIYTYVGNSINVYLPAEGVYTVVLSVKKNNINYTKIFENFFELKSTKWDGTQWLNGNPTVNTSIEFEGDFLSTSTISGCSCKVVSGNVIIDSGTNLILNGIITVQGGSLTINNNANLVQVQETQNIGNIIVKRESNPLKRLDYTIWSSPVLGTQTLKQFSPLTLNNRFYNYNTSTNFYSVIPNPVTQTFIKANGYLIRMPDNHPTSPTIWEGTFNGTPNNGQTEIDLTYVSDGFSYNMIGNPYPSTIDAEAFLTANEATINGTLYFWRKTNNAPGTAYATYTLGGATTTSPTSPIPSGIIQVGQGFFVEAKNVANPKAVFSNTMRIQDNNNQFFRNSSITEKHRFWINLTNSNGLFSQIMVGYMTNATNGIDNGIDGKRIKDNATALSSLLDNEEFTIQGKALPFDTNDTVPLNFKTDLAGNFTISIDNVDGLFADGQQIFLKDNSLQETHNLSQAEYNFYSDAGNFNNRFEIVYQNSFLSTNNVDKAIIQVYPNPIDKNNCLYFKGFQDEVTFSLYDVMGKQLIFKKTNDNKILLNGIAEGVYFVKINSNSNSIFKKIIIK